MIQGQQKLYLAKRGGLWWPKLESWCCAHKIHCRFNTSITLWSWNLVQWIYHTLDMIWHLNHVTNTTYVQQWKHGGWRGTCAIHANTRGYMYCIYTAITMHESCVNRDIECAREIHLQYSDGHRWEDNIYSQSTSTMLDTNSSGVAGGDKG